jgi:hypothetical protein
MSLFGYLILDDLGSLCLLSVTIEMEGGELKSDRGVDQVGRTSRL